MEQLSNNIYDKYPMTVQHYDAFGDRIRTIQHFGMSILPLANFDVFNATYNDDSNWCECSKCDGKGAKLEYDWEGDGSWAMSVTRLEPCANCIGDEKCPGCGSDLKLSFDLSAFGATIEWVAYDNPYYATNLGYLKRSFDYEDTLAAMSFEGFTCSCCGWTFDAERLYDYDEPDYYDDGDYDYPALDASDYFPL